jgi:hypothetical protein
MCYSYSKRKRRLFYLLPQKIGEIFENAVFIRQKLTLSTVAAFFIGLYSYFYTIFRR